MIAMFSRCREYKVVKISTHFTPYLSVSTLELLESTGVDLCTHIQYLCMNIVLRFHTQRRRGTAASSSLLRHDVLRFSKMLHYQHHHLRSQLPAPLLPAQPSEGRLKAMVAPYPIPQLAPSGGTGHTGEIQLRQLTELHCCEFCHTNMF